ncbi:AraC family transcriptional regulator [Catellatospora sichuanensis]|uniref:AraC family transcriptional regulator n=1 Tax=Catellatospora sichuanensis TaxID=1969805 RepID=UPI001642E4FC|nr:AraC family transcriptional regulator [Catellatospora sichuanensis]
MQVRVPAHERTVHPDLARAALLGARRHGPSPAADAVARWQAAAEPVPERLHHALLAELTGHGWQALRGAAEHLLDRPREGDIAEVIERGSVSELAARLPELQLRFHVGHTTDLRLEPGRLVVSHRALLGGVPNPAESLFTAAIHEVVLGACAGRRPAVTVRFADGSTVTGARPGERSLTGRGKVEGWTIDLSTTQEAAVSPVAAVRDMIAADPARRWRLDAAAARSGVSTRSLQRMLAEQGTGFRAVVSGTRLGVARGLVQRTDLGLAEIAAACGFTDHAHLTRCFTARHGVPPSAMRAQVTAHGV